jgi:hypothetical protein
MKRILHSTSLLVSGGLVILITCLWAWSYHAPHSLLFSHACGEVECLTDRGIIQVNLVWGDTECRGVSWDSHQRSAGWGRAELDLFGPEAGIGRLFADIGFATWSYTRTLQMFFGPSLPGRVFFFPFWFVMLFSSSMLAWHGWMSMRRHRSINPVERTAALQAAVAHL